MNYSTTIIVGRIGKHAPQVKQAGRSSYAGFTVAVNRGYKDKQEPSWFHVRLWGKAGEVFGKYARPGQEVLLRGEHRQERWKDKQGQNHEMWVLHCWEGELGRMPGGDARSSGEQQGGGAYADAGSDYSDPDIDSNVPF